LAKRRRAEGRRGVVIAVISTIVVEHVRQRLRAEHKGALLRGARVKAKAPEKSEFITITSEAHSRRSAALLANLTSQAYIKRRTAASRRAVEKALAISTDAIAASVRSDCTSCTIRPAQ